MNDETSTYMSLSMIIINVGFHAIKIVEQIYNYIENYQITDFINLWDFLSKRFFMHLDQEKLLLLDNMKSDLIKFYLVNLINHNKKQEMNEFFVTYSHEIIAESGNSTHQLRSWYAVTHAQTHTHIHTHKYTHTYIYIHTHTHTA
jgi:hypothetical protein